ncbi:unnamed protein product [Rotaria magnacalcarata]|uniref:N-acetylmuramoyl-L-alanine amidase domain-containing protein n=5 Tax=Rotaria magnacalcarata TaxID=392030 RepID=A0A816VDW5_9BILA|nr:unnamed protein product [Rotaria magnacalcarata]
MWISMQFMMAAILPWTTFAQQYGTCTARNGLSGECINTGMCSANGGISDPANLCPGDNTIQCCTYGTCKNSKGVAGICQPTSTCKGSSDPANLCPGGNHIQCCTVGSTPTGPGPSKPINTMLTGLADILRGVGLNVVEVAGWKTRGHGVMASVKGIIVHHTAGSSTGDYPSLAVVRDGTSSLAGPLSQLGLGRSGTWFVIAAGRCYHAGSTLDDSIYGNSNAIGIEAEGVGLPATDSGHAHWPEVQYQSYVKGVKALQNAYGVPTARVLGHKEAAVPKGRKIDPNFSMAEFRTKLG